MKQPTLDAEGTFYLNAAGQIMDYDATVTKSGDYAYIYTITYSDDVNSEGIKAPTYTAYFVTQDGVKDSAIISSDFIGNDPSDICKDEKATVTNKKLVIPYKINSDGEMEKVTGEDTVESATKPSKPVDKDNAVIKSGQSNATSNTQFIFIDRSNTSKVKVSTVTGYKNVKIETTANVFAITDDDDYAVYVFVDAANGNVEATGYVAVMLDPKAEVTKDDDNTYYTYSVSIDGEDTTLTTKDSTAWSALSGLAKGSVFSYNLEDDYVVDVNDAAETGITLNRGKNVSAANDDYVVIAGQQYNLGTESVYTIVKDYDKNGKLDSVAVSAGGEISTDYKVTFTIDKDGDLDVVFVIIERK